METIKEIVKLGAPVALQDLLVSISFLAITAIVNQLGVIASAGVGVAEKVCTFILLVPSALRSIHFRLCRAEYRRRISCPQRAEAGNGLWDRDLVIVRNLYELFRLFPWRFAFPGLFARDPQVILAAAII